MADRQTWRKGSPLDLTGDKQVVLTPDQRSQHMYISGLSGTGKTKYLEYLVRQDIRPSVLRKHSLVVLDPHGGLYEALLTYCARKGIRDVVPINLSDPSVLVGFNLLAHREDTAVSNLVDSVAMTILHAWGADSFNQTPTLYRVMRSLIWKLYELNLTLADAPHFLFHAGIQQLRTMIRHHVEDQSLANSALAELAQLRRQELSREVTSSLNRLSFLADHPIITPMLGTSGPSLRLRNAIDENKIILVNLGGTKHTGPQESALFGSLFLSALWLAIKERGKPNDPSRISPVYCYCDELELFLSPVVAQGLAEARGFGLHFVLANQFPSQIRLAGDGPVGERILAEVMNNCSTKISFRLGDPRDLELMAHQLFFGQLDPLKEKYRLLRTTTVGHEIMTFHNYTSSLSTPLGPTETTSYDANDLSGVDSDAARLSVTEAPGSASYGHTQSQALIPILGQELSQIKEYAIEEQRLLDQQEIFRLPNRQALIKTPSLAETIRFRTPDIHPGRPLPKHSKLYLDELQQSLPYLYDGDRLREEVQRRRRLMMQSPRSQPEPTVFDD